MTPRQAKELIKWAKSQGVTRMRVGELEVEFEGAPPQDGVMGLVSQPAPQADPLAEYPEDIREKALGHAEMEWSKRLEYRSA